jgi:HEAT repeat protein
MSREELYGLATDMDRLVGAGASTASASDKLRDRGKVVAELAKKVPTLAPLAQGIDKVRSASGKAAAGALLDLLVMTQQLRRSLTNIGVAGELEKNSRPGSWKTPLSTRQFRLMHEAVSEPGSDREESLERAFKDGNLIDLRLLSPMLEQAERGNSTVWDFLSEHALPAFGKDILPEIEAKLDIKGKSLSSRLLPVVCRIDPPRGRELCLAALEQGSVEMKVEALDCLPKVGQKGEAEEWAIKLVKEKGQNVRTAALRTLSAATSAAAFDVLMESVRDHNYDIWDTALDSLMAMEYPQATPRLVDHLKQAIADAEKTEAELAEVKKAQKSAARKGAPTAAKGKKKAANPTEEVTGRFDNALEFVGRLTRGVAGRKDEARREATDVLFPLLKWKAFTDAVELVELLGALASAGGNRADVRSHLEAMLEDKSFPKVSEALTAFLSMTPQDRSPSVPKILAVLDRPKVPEWVREEVFGGLEDNFAAHKKLIVPKVRQVLAEKKESSVQDAALDLIRDVGEPAKELLPEVLEYIRRGTGYYGYAEEIVVKFDPTGKKTIPTLIESLATKSKFSHMMAADCLGKYGQRAASAVPELEKRLKDKDWSVRYHIEAALEEIRKSD